MAYVGNDIIDRNNLANISDDYSLNSSSVIASTKSVSSAKQDTVNYLKSIGYGNDLVAISIDADAFFTSGEFFIDHLLSTNLPEYSKGILKVYKSSASGITIQKYITVSLSEYTRSYVSGAWSSWHKTITSSNLSGYNYIVDGAFDFWYEGTTQTGAGYGSDTMWKNDSVGSTKVHSQQPFSLGEMFPDGTLCPSYFSRTIVSSVVGVNNGTWKYQEVEDVKRLANKTVTLSFYAKADTNKNISVCLQQNFGTGGSVSAVLPGLGSTVISLTNVWKKYSVVFSVPSIASKSIGTNNNSSTQVLFVFEMGSTLGAKYGNIGQQSGTFDLALVKLEDGTVSSSYFRDVPSEEQRVNRYYEKFDNTMGFSSYCPNGTQLLWTVPFRTRKRTHSSSISFTNINYYNTSNISTNSISDSRLQIQSISTATGMVYASTTAIVDARL